MKQLTHIRSLALTAMLMLVTAVANAQADIKVDINKESSSSSTWYTNPIVWIIGAAVFILLLVALLRGGSRRD